MSEEKPREIELHYHTATGLMWPKVRVVDEQVTIIRFIEKSAYDALRAQVEELKKQCPADGTVEVYATTIARISQERDRLKSELNGERETFCKLMNEANEIRDRAVADYDRLKSENERLRAAIQRLRKWTPDDPDTPAEIMSQALEGKE